MSADMYFTGRTLDVDDRGDDTLQPCVVCGAAVADRSLGLHARWHDLDPIDAVTVNPFTVGDKFRTDEWAKIRTVTRVDSAVVRDGSRGWHWSEVEYVA